MQNKRIRAIFRLEYTTASVPFLNMDQVRWISVCIVTYECFFGDMKLVLGLIQTYRTH
jgi:hypothetical protein